MNLRNICSVFMVLGLAYQLQAQSVNSDSAVNDNGVFEQITDFFTYEHPKFSISTYPVVNYSPDVGLGLGFTPIVRILPDTTKAISDFYRPTTLVPYLMVSTKGSITFESDFIVFTNNRWTFVTQMRFAEFPNAYYGIGGPTTDSVPYQFRSTDLFLIGELAKGIGNLVFAGLRYDFHRVENETINDNYSNQDIQGFDGGWNTGLGPVVKLDTRDDIIYPTKGWFATGFALFNTKALGGDYTYNVLALDIRKYISLPGNENVLALQYANLFTFGDVPFYKMPGLGGATFLRGIEHPNKYIDKNRWLAQAEYRKHLFWRVGATAFVGTGAVYNESTNYTNNIQAVVGAGFRFRIVPDDRLNFRADYGMSLNGDKAFYMTIREAF